MNLTRKTIIAVLLQFFTVLAFAQETEVITPPVYVDFRTNHPVEITILKPETFIKTRAFSPDATSGVVQIEGIIKDQEGIKALKINGSPTLVQPQGRFEKLILIPDTVQYVLFEVIDGHDKSEEIRYDILKPIQAIQSTTSLDQKGEYYALLIGVNEYQDNNIQDLDKPISDANALKSVLLSKYQFKKNNVTQLNNASRYDIIDALDALSGKITTDDNLLIFYAGHGYWDEDSEIGYWIPSNARKESKADWVRNSTIRDYMREIKSKHSLLIADACFAGGIFKTRDLGYKSSENLNTSAISKLYGISSRKAMTSGTLTKVPDRSAFTKYLVKRLEENGSKYLPASELFANMRIAVINNSDVVPQFGTIQNVGDEGGGDFIFTKK